MSVAEERARQIGAAARERAVSQLAARLRDELPDRAVRVEADGATVTGRGVLRDPRLAWVGSLLR